MTVTRERAIWLGSYIFPHEASLRQWLSRRAGDGVAEIDDIVQESYAILAALPDVAHIHNPRTYFFQVAKSIVLQTLRRSRVVTIDSYAATELLEIPEDAPSPERIVADRQELSRVATLIAALPARCREVFTLRKVQGLSQHEVAENLGIAESTVEKHMGKAISLLADAIGRGGKAADQTSSAREPRSDHSAWTRSRDRDRA